jgi:FixJ family two-component response regulator
MNGIFSAVRHWLRSVVGEKTAALGPRIERSQGLALRPVLLASERDDDHHALQTILHNTRWTLARASSWADAADFCARPGKPVILVDRYFRGSDWRFTVSSLVNLEADSCLILLSDVSDQYLWNEVVQHGGFDVLARPFEHSVVLRTLAFAQKHREGVWPPLRSS